MSRNVFRAATMDKMFMFETLIKLDRKYKTSLQLLADIFLAFFSLFFAILLRGEDLGIFVTSEVIFGVVLATSVTISVFALKGVYYSLVRFITTKILYSILIGILAGAIILELYFSTLEIEIKSRTVVIYVILFFLLSSSLRFCVRQFFRGRQIKFKKPTIIYGAGAAGSQLQNSLIHSDELEPIVFIDDNEKLHGLHLGECKICAPKKLKTLIQAYSAEVLLLAMPMISNERRREIIEDVYDQKIEIRTIPPINKILSGQAIVSDIKPVAAEMLLGRDPVPPKTELMRQNIEDKCVMITGAGGSIGSEICQQVLIHKPSKLVLVDLSELALYQIVETMTASIKNFDEEIAIEMVLGSVCDERLNARVIHRFGVDTIYHAAAYKHVPIVEDNMIEGIKNNVFGTLALVNAAVKARVENFTLVSTDKAVRPTNIMGATKRIAELICQVHSEKFPGTKFTLVRFGNVIESAGSVIPRFRKQIENNGPVTVTHPEITRYFMTIPEAAVLVIQAGALGDSGDVLVLDMGEPIKITELATQMIKLSGKHYHFIDDLMTKVDESGSTSIGIKFTGLRKGEKLYEELLIGENPESTVHPRIMKIAEKSISETELNKHLIKLDKACNCGDEKAALECLKIIPIEFIHNNNVTHIS